LKENKMGIETILQLGLGMAQVDLQRKAANKQAEASRVQQRAQARSTLRQAQIQRGRMAQVGQTLGATTTNTLGAQFGANAGLATQLSGLSGDISRLNTQVGAFSLLGKILPSIDFNAMSQGASMGGMGGSGSLRQGLD